MWAVVSHQSFLFVDHNMGNILEYVTIPMHPQITTIKDKMLELGAKAAMMSGSGPTVFGIFENEKTAKRAKEKIKESDIARQVYVTRPYDPTGSYGR